MTKFVLIFADFGFFFAGKNTDFVGGISKQFLL